MLMQLIAWTLGALLVLLTLLYAAIFTAMATAKFRQTLLRRADAASTYPIRDLRGVERARLNSMR